MFNSDGLLNKPDPDSSRVSSDGPFFTVLIPTMNRPHLLKAALRTVMWQTFANFEVIVSDNSNDNESRTKNHEAIIEYAEDPRVRYIRPDHWMNMPDHWEFATRHASGRYVVILTDRHVMRPSALKFLHTKISYFPEEPEVVAWHSASELNRSGIVYTSKFTGVTDVLDSKQEICEFAKCENWRSSAIWSNRLPRMLNSCYRFDLAHRIRQKNGRLFIPLSPDYTCAFLLLAYTNKLVYLDQPLLMSHGIQSNGSKCLVHGAEHYISSLGDVDLFAGLPVPLKVPTNLIFRDFLIVKSLVGERFSDVSLDVVGYFMCIYREFLVMERLGTQVDIHSLYAKWWDALSKLDQKKQIQITKYAKELDQQRAAFIGLRRFSVRWRLDRLYNATVAKIRRIRHRFTGKPVYADVFEAAIQTNCILTDTIKTDL